MNKRRTSGLIVRLIDIVMLLLFGFISISTMDAKSKVRLSESTDMPQTNPDSLEILIIGIPENDVYLIESRDKRTGSAEIAIKGLENIKEYITVRNIDYLNRNKKMKVRIRTNWYLPIKYAMEIALHCDADSIEKGLDVRLVSRK